MKRLIPIVCLSLACLVAIGRPPKPVSGFTATPSSGAAPLSVQFANQSTGSYYAAMMSFGDGANEATVQSFYNHTYGSGTFTATLTLTGKGGSSSSSRTVMVTNGVPPPPPPLLTSGTFWWPPAPGAAVYQLSLNNSLYMTFGTNYLVRGLTNGTSYIATVQCADTNNQWSHWSCQVQFTAGSGVTNSCP